nr:PAS domain-containing protein [Caulobacter sp. 17J80-11]
MADTGIEGHKLYRRTVKPRDSSSQRQGAAPTAKPERRRTSSLTHATTVVEELTPVHESYWTLVPEALFTVRVTPAGEFLFGGINPAHERLTGLRATDLIGRRPEDCLPPAAAAAVSERYRACVGGGEALRYEETLTLPTGERTWETTLVPIRDSRGEIVLLLGSGREITEHVRTREALAEREARLSAMAETVPDVLFSADGRGRLTYLNGRFAERTGIPVEAALGDGWIGVVHPDDLEAVREVWRAVRGPLAPFEYECRLRDTGGRWRWHLVRARAMPDGQGGMQWFGAATDIDHVKRSAEELARLNGQLESLLAGISDGYFTLDHNGRVTSANPRAERWFADPIGRDFIGIPFLERFGQSSELIDAVARVLDTERPEHGEVASTLYPGRWMELHLYPLAGGASVFFRDITEARLRRRELEETKWLLQRSLDSLSAHVAILDEAGVVIAVNRAWRRFAERNTDRVGGAGVGVSYVEACRAAAPTSTDAARVLAGLEAMQAGQRSSFYHTYRVETAPPRWFQLRVSRFDHDGAVRFVVAHEDVTEVHQAHLAVNHLTRQLLAIQEDERRKIAAELHDSTGQHLVALSLGVARLAEIAGHLDGVDPIIADVRASLEEAQKELRVFSYLLHPPHLGADGLGYTLRRFVEGFSRRSDLKISLNVSSGVDGLDYLIQRNLLRVVQESLSNVHRHARATRAWLTLELKSDRLLLTVEDDGDGFPRGLEGGPDLGVGIPGMTARVAECGGALHIGKGRRGALVRAVFPIQPARGLAEDVTE